MHEAAGSVITASKDCTVAVSTLGEGCSGGLCICIEIRGVHACLVYGRHVWLHLGACEVLRRSCPSLKPTKNSHLKHCERTAAQARCACCGGTRSCTRAWSSARAGGTLVPPLLAAGTTGAAAWGPKCELRGADAS